MGCHNSKVSSETTKPQKKQKQKQNKVPIHCRELAPQYPMRVSIPKIIESEKQKRTSISTIQNTQISENNNNNNNNSNLIRINSNNNTNQRKSTFNLNNQSTVPEVSYNNLDNNNNIDNSFQKSDFIPQILPENKYDSMLKQNNNNNNNSPQFRTKEKRNSQNLLSVQQPSSLQRSQSNSPCPSKKHTPIKTVVVNDHLNKQSIPVPVLNGGVATSSLIKKRINYLNLSGINTNNDNTDFTIQEFHALTTNRSKASQESPRVKSNSNILIMNCQSTGVNSHLTSQQQQQQL